MFILNPFLCYNSLDIIPYTIEYYQKEKIDIFVLDNYSSDGSWEFLQHNKISSKRVDTNETFNLALLLKNKFELIRNMKPDWVIRVGSDCFVTTYKPLREIIEDANKEGFNAVSMPFIRLWNTGEKRVNQDPRKVFFNYSIVLKDHICMYKVKDFKGYKADRTRLKNENVKRIEESCILDYGNTRGKEKREEEYQRRQLAWDQGLSRRYGTHYISASEVGWLWDSKNFKDIRKSKYWEIICNRFGF